MADADNVTAAAACAGCCGWCSCCCNCCGCCDYCCNCSGHCDFLKVAPKPPSHRTKNRSLHPPPRSTEGVSKATGSQSHLAIRCPPITHVIPFLSHTVSCDLQPHPRSSLLSPAHTKAKKRAPAPLVLTSHPMNTLLAEKY